MLEKGKNHTPLPEGKCVEHSPQQERGCPQMTNRSSNGEMSKSRKRLVALAFWLFVASLVILAASAALPLIALVVYPWASPWIAEVFWFADRLPPHLSGEDIIKITKVSQTGTVYAIYAIVFIGALVAADWVGHMKQESALVALVVFALAVPAAQGINYGLYSLGANIVSKEDSYDKIPDGVKGFVKNHFYREKTVVIIIDESNSGLTSTVSINPAGRTITVSLPSSLATSRESSLTSSTVIATVIPSVPVNN